MAGSWDATSPVPRAPRPSRTCSTARRPRRRQVARPDGGRGRWAADRAGQCEQHRGGFPVLQCRLLDRARGCRALDHADRGGHARRSLPGALGLHRMEINIRPENLASLAVVRKLGLRTRGCGALPAHRRGVARPPVVRGDDGGPGRAVPHGTLCTVVKESLWRHTDPSPSGGLAHVPTCWHATLVPHLRGDRGRLGCLPRPALDPSPRAHRDRAPVDAFSETLRVLKVRTTAPRSTSMGRRASRMP